MTAFYDHLFWWGVGIIGTIGTSLTIAASLSVIRASRKVLVHDVKIDTIIDNQKRSHEEHKEHQKEVLDANNKIISLFLSEIDPVKEDAIDLRKKVEDHSERIIRVETRLKIK